MRRERRATCVPPVRLFVTFLSPAVVVVPAVFLHTPAVTGLLTSSDPEPFEELEFAVTPPIVMVVFDQLPLPSLLDRAGEIDAKLYPNFASLSLQASWFRNASAVSELTQTALPAILTGNLPVAGKLPVAHEFPDSLFTLLGSRYRLEVAEPLTRLCPETVCERDRPGIVAWFASVLQDISVVYLHIVMPDDITAMLPPVTQNWKDFVTNGRTGPAMARTTGYRPPAGRP